jgi:hypothetical protein
MFFAASVFAQTDEREEKLEINGEIVTALITESDTFIIADLETISISSPRTFKNNQEYKRYLLYRRYANFVYPYAKDAIRIFRETEHVTQTMSKRKRKKHIKRLQKELKKDFKEPMKNLTRTQGKILIKMIEKELDTSFYALLKSLRGGFTATYYNEFGKFYGYNLKDGYVPGEDPILDAVLHDFNISYRLKK